MADPPRSTPAGSAGRDDALAALLRGVRLAPDGPATLAAAVEALAAGTDGVAWVAADADLDGVLQPVAVAGPAGPVADVRGAETSGDEPWRAACESEGLRLAAWAPLEAASLPAARLGLAVLPERPAPGIWLAAVDEVARWLGAALDADAGRAAAARLQVVAGRVAWLEASRDVARILRHDLANKLTGISFYSSQLAGVLETGTASTQEAELIDDLVATSGALLEQLRRLWRDPPEAEVVPVDPSMVVAGILPMLTAVAEPCVLDVGRLDPIVVRASPRGLEEAILALVVDACGADRGAGPRHIRVEVAVEQLADDNPLGLAAGRYAAVLVTGAADAAAAGAATNAVARTTAAAELPLPGEPGFGLALAAASARAWGGAVHLERIGDAALTTILLPEAVARRRDAAPDADAVAADRDSLGEPHG